MRGSIRERAVIDTRVLFAPERAELLGVLAELTPDQWNLSTVCPGWSVHDVALHLLWIDISNISRRRDAWFGRREDAPDDLDDLNTLIAFVNQLNDNWIAGARRLSPHLLQTLLLVTGQEFSRYVESVDIVAMGDSIGWAGPEPAPVWVDIAREFTERWVHQQHIRDAVGIPGAAGPQFLKPVLATFALALPYALRNVSADHGAIAELAITGESGGVWRAEKGREGWKSADDSDAQPDGSVAIHQDVAWRLFTKGLSSKEARRAATVTGDTAISDAMLDMVTILA